MREDPEQPAEEDAIDVAGDPTDMLGHAAPEGVPLCAALIEQVEEYAGVRLIETQEFLIRSPFKEKNTILKTRREN